MIINLFLSLIAVVMLLSIFTIPVVFWQVVKEGASKKEVALLVLTTGILAVVAVVLASTMWQMSPVNERNVTSTLYDTNDIIAVGDNLEYVIWMSGDRPVKKYTSDLSLKKKSIQSLAAEDKDKQILEVRTRRDGFLGKILIPSKSYIIELKGEH